LIEERPTDRIEITVVAAEEGTVAFTRLMRILLFLAVAANSVDLVATALGIHYYHNREGNPLLAGMAHGSWPLFVLVKGLLVPLLILRLNSYRRSSPVLAAAGLAIVTVALTVAVGLWIGWMAGNHHVASMGRL
jgi:hypothetical protein